MQIHPESSSCQKAKPTYQYSVYIGRFQPFHNGHYSIIKKALEISSTLIVVVGSDNIPRSIRNPWTAAERIQMIEDSLTEQEYNRIIFATVSDFTYDDSAWTSAVEQAVLKKVESNKSHSIAVVGYSKDHSSTYLNFFPQWNHITIDIPMYHDRSIINATDVRNIIFKDPAEKSDQEFLRNTTPLGVRGFIRRFRLDNHIEYMQLVKEQNYILQYKKIWSNTPYPPTFVTVDAVVIQSGHILLVERGSMPGAGLWAMPGGFIGEFETLADSVIRELREETGLKIPVKVLRGSIVCRETFDHPDRSNRGRTITTAFLFKLDDTQPLPKIKGGDDAKTAKWFSIAEFNKMQSEMFEDHYHIVQKMLARS